MTSGILGIGPMELLIVVGCAVVPLIVLGVVLFVVFAANKKNHGGNESLAVLQEENARLRAENARLKKEPPSGTKF